MLSSRFCIVWILFFCSFLLRCFGPICNVAAYIYRCAENYWLWCMNLHASLFLLYLDVVKYITLLVMFDVKCCFLNVFGSNGWFCIWRTRLIVELHIQLVWIKHSPNVHLCVSQSVLHFLSVLGMVDVSIVLCKETTVFWDTTLLNANRQFCSSYSNQATTNSRITYATKSQRSQKQPIKIFNYQNHISSI